MKSQHSANGSKLRILILSADVGRGHRSAARAIGTALQCKYGDRCHPIEANPVDEPSVPTLVRDAQRDHTRLIRSFPQVYSLALRVSNSGPARNLSTVAGSMVLNEGVAAVVERHRPAAVIATHPILLEALAKHASSDGSYGTATVITDLMDMHKIWFNQRIDLTLVPTPEAAELGLKQGLEPDQIRVTGIPVHPELSKTITPKSVLRQRLGLAADRFTVLVVGSRRVNRLETYLRLLNRAQLPVQVIAVAGEDEELYNQFQEINWQIPAAVFGFVDDMSQLLQAADCLVSKAGGLIVVEAMAAGLPFLVTQCLPNHEKGNAAYIVTKGAGDYVKEPSLLVSTLRRWLKDDGQLYAQQAANARSIGRPRAAYDVADALWQIALRRPPNQNSNGHPIGTD